MKSAAAALVLMSIATGPAFSQSTSALQQQFDQAERRIVRLPPAAFPELSGNVGGELQRRGCTIPQTAYTKKPHNVISGEFAKSGQTDWAVLCFVKGVSTILVFWGGSEKNPAEIATTEDRIFLQESHLRRSDTREKLRRLARTSSCGTTMPTVGRPETGNRTRPTKPPPIDYLGIDMRFLRRHLSCGISTPGNG